MSLFFSFIFVLIYKRFQKYIKKATEGYERAQIMITTKRETWGSGKSLCLNIL